MHRQGLHSFTTICLALASSCVASVALADEASMPDRISSVPNEATARAVDRTWLYADDAKVAAPMSAVGTSSLSYTDIGTSPARVRSAYRSFAGNTAQPGGLLSIGGEVGVLPRVSLIALGQVGYGEPITGPHAGALAGLRVRLSPAVWQGAHLVASGGYLREAWQGRFFDESTGRWHQGLPNGGDGAWGQLALAVDIQRFAIACTLHGEHVFSDGRDGIDTMVQAGASYRLVGGLRAGLEYVGQDLEESFSAGSEGGARHFLGPTASLQLLRDRLTLAAGPAVGLSEASPRFLARFAFAYGF